MADSLKLTGNLGEVAALLRRARVEIVREMQEAERQVAEEARQLAVLGLNMGVYSTAPGRYRRTQDLLNGVQCVPLVGGGGVYGVRVDNTSQHATQVEFGSMAEEIDLAMATEMSSALGPKVAPLYLGRSGEKYQRPNPAMTRAAVFASFALQEKFTATLKRWL